jgi:hypothetical protein
MLNCLIKKYLDNLSKNVKPLQTSRGEFEIAKEIRNIIKKEESSYKSSDEDIAEQMAFDFLADYPNNNSGWGTYYGPMYVLPNKQGQMVEYPSIQKVTKETLIYWEKRAKETKNPILSSRYADLVMDFSQTVLQKSADYKLFHLAIDANIEICEKLLIEPIGCQKKVKRALTLAIMISDKGRIKRLKEAIINLEEKIAEDEKAGLWGFAFKWLLLDFCKKVNTTSQERDHLINSLEKRLERVKSVWSVERAVSLLAEYYANKKDETNLMRVLGILEKFLKEDKRTNSSSLLKIHAFESIHEIYQRFRDKGFPEATKATNRISQEIGHLNLDWDKSLKKISTTTNIKKEEIDKFLKNIFGEKKQDELETILTKIAIYFIPKQRNIENQLKKVAKDFPLQFLCTTQVISEDGIPIARLSSLEGDYDRHFQRYASQYLQFSSVLLLFAIDELKKQFSKNKIEKYFLKSALLQNENKEYLQRAIDAYWNNDYIVSSHLFIPLIESAIRELIRICGGVVLKPNDMSGYDRLTLNFLLENQGAIIKNVYSDIDPDMSFYFRLVLTEKLGMNLRNNFAHGLEKNTFFLREASDRLFHILICLALANRTVS